MTAFLPELARHVHSPPRVTKPQLGERPSWWSQFTGIRCPNCGRPQSPGRMSATNPSRGHNRTDFHMCGGCGRYLFLTGERRLRRFFLLHLPVFFGVGLTGFSVLRNIDGINIYRDAREAYEPNFLGFLIICVSIYIALNFTGRFEIVGAATPPEADKLDAQGDQES